VLSQNLKPVSIDDAAHPELVPLRWDRPSAVAENREKPLADHGLDWVAPQLVNYTDEGRRRFWHDLFLSFSVLLTSAIRS